MPPIISAPVSTQGTEKILVKSGVTYARRARHYREKDLVRSNIGNFHRLCALIGQTGMETGKEIRVEFCYKVREPGLWRTLRMSLRYLARRLKRAWRSTRHRS